MVATKYQQTIFVFHLRLLTTEEVPKLGGFPQTVAPAILNDIASNQSKLKTSGRTNEWGDNLNLPDVPQVGPVGQAQVRPISLARIGD